MITHGMSWHPLYNVWKAMRQRCYTKMHPRYKQWGGRGIKICVAWRTDPRPFINWGEDNGWRPGLEIDRKNNDRGYSPGNCRFVTNKVQASNRRPAVLTAAGKLAISLAVAASNKRRARHARHA